MVQETSKRQARQAVNKAVYRGILPKPSACSQCGRVSRIEGHHYDYDKPLDITWLCRRCHVFRHPLYSRRRPKRRSLGPSCTCLHCGYTWSPFKWNRSPKYCARCHKEGWRKGPVLDKV